MQKTSLPNIRLSIYGCVRAVENSVPLAVSSFDWKNAVADAGILAAITFFTTLGGLTAVSIPTAQAVMGAGIGALGQFFIVLGIKRKLIKEA